VSFPAPASLLSKASIAEASRTTLLTSGSLAALGDELCGQRAAGIYVAANAPLCALQAALERADPQLVILNAQHDFIAVPDTQCLAESSRNQVDESVPAPVDLLARKRRYCASANALAITDSPIRVQSAGA